MASLFPAIAYHTNTLSPIWGTSTSTSTSSHFIFFPSSINRNLSSPIHLHRSFAGTPLHHSRLILRSSAGPPPSPPGKEPQNLVATFSRVWDTVQIFFAVLFWMSLFFWASVSDGKNTGRGNKRDRSRK